MAGAEDNRPRRSRRRPPPSRWSKISLATIGTLVAIATGIVTLRDELFPPDDDGGTSVAVYQQQVGEICDDVNDGYAEVQEGHRAFAKEVRENRSLADLRTAVLAELQGRLDLLGTWNAKLEALDPPSDLEGSQRVAAQAWARNLDRFRVQRAELRKVRDRADFDRAVESLDRTALDRDALRATTELRRLGGAACRLDVRRTPEPVTPKPSRDSPTTPADVTPPLPPPDITPGMPGPPTPPPTTPTAPLCTTPDCGPLPSKLAPEDPSDRP